MGGSTAQKNSLAFVSTYIHVSSRISLNHEWALMHTYTLRGGNKVVGSK